MPIAITSPVTLLFSRGTGFVAWLVRTFTKSKYSHVSIAFIDGQQRWLCEANQKFGMVGVTRLETLLQGEYLVVPTRIGMTKEVRDFLFTTATGQKYSWGDFIRAGAGLQPKYQGYQCAELVQALYKVAGGNLPWAPTPQHILDQLRALPDYSEFIAEQP